MSEEKKKKEARKEIQKKLDEVKRVILRWQRGTQP